MLRKIFRRLELEVDLSVRRRGVASRVSEQLTDTGPAGDDPLSSLQTVGGQKSLGSEWLPKL
jgi:hypothetical protein